MLLEEKSRIGISGGTLKIIALITMIIDHATAIFVPEQCVYWNVIGRGIGRLAFPIYCFLIVEGFFHTRNVKKYMARLFLFALISEVPFDLAFYNTAYHIGHQNVFFTLGMGILLMYLIQIVRVRIDESQKAIKGALFVVVYLAVFAAVWVLKTDYSVNGLLMILMFYLFHGNKTSVSIVNVMMNYLMEPGGIQLYGAFSVVPIWLYNGKKGISLKYFFYVIYPLHLLVFYMIKQYMM